MRLPYKVDIFNDDQANPSCQAKFPGLKLMHVKPLYCSTYQESRLGRSPTFPEGLQPAATTSDQGHA